MKQLWIDTRLNEEEMNFLNDTISEENMRGIKRKIKDFSEGGLRKYSDLVDKDNWFYETALKKLTERIFYRNWDNYFEYHIEKKEPLPEFIMKFFWVNYQKQHEFSAFHDHRGLYSFVIFIKIPTHYQFPAASDFQFVWSEKNTKNVISTDFQLSPEDEGRMLFFPGTLQHKGNVIYNTEDERITISGNINQVDPNKPEKQEVPVSVYEEKENIIRVMENAIEITKEELKMMHRQPSPTPPIISEVAAPHRKDFRT